MVGREKEAPFGRRTVYCLGILVFGLSLTIPSVAAEARYTASLANGGADSVKHDMPMTASMRKLAHRVLKRVSDDASAETGSSTRIILWDELGRERRRDLLWQPLLSRRSWPLARRVIARAQN